MPEIFLWSHFYLLIILFLLFLLWIIMNYLFNQVGLFEINHPLFFKRDRTTRAAAYNKIQPKNTRVNNITTPAPTQNLISHIELSSQVEKFSAVQTTAAHLYKGRELEEEYSSER